VAAAKQDSIHIIPQINLLGHQSWAGKTENLLAVYPQFDETPWVKMPAVYKWPNSDSLYCKSYCPLHPGVHKVVFDIVDEICDAFETDAFHAGMDEVFYLGEAKCPRCRGKNKAELFAGEVRTIRDHLAQKGRKLWIWGDRLLDGKATGMGMWEASYNNTHGAIDMIPKDVVICDWHYERPDKTAVYFAMKGFNVITCPWRKPGVAVQQVRDMVAFRQQATREMQPRYLGVMHTVWTSVSNFLNEFYGKQQQVQNGRPADPVNTSANTLRAMYVELQLQQPRR
jgi:N-acetyl-beta-hexosaminidase